VELLPGTGDGASGLSGVHADVAVPPAGGSLDFQIALQLKGSEGVYFTPVGRSNRVTLRSNWPGPSFQGNWLPDRHDVKGDGFQASWSVSSLGRNFPQSWLENSVQPQVLEASRFGVDLLQTNDHYQRTSRSVKYAGLFLLLTFVTLWLVEVLCRVRVHPIQYVLIGGAMTVFYLLLLSLSEHIGFTAAYVAATVAIVAQISVYSRFVLGTPRRAALLGTTVAALYGYLCVVLVNEDYALLIGSLGVFAVLALVMALTRRVDWFAPGTGTPAGAP
jgi:inner membrane protein